MLILAFFQFSQVSTLTRSKSSDGFSVRLAGFVVIGGSSIRYTAGMEMLAVTIRDDKYATSLCAARIRRSFPSTKILGLRNEVLFKDQAYVPKAGY